MRSCQALLFENLVGGSTPLPPSSSSRKVGVHTINNSSSKTATFKVANVVNVLSPTEQQRVSFTLTCVAITTFVSNEWGVEWSKICANCALVNIHLGRDYYHLLTNRNVGERGDMHTGVLWTWRYCSFSSFIEFLRKNQKYRRGKSPLKYFLFFQNGICWFSR